MTLLFNSLLLLAGLGVIVFGLVTVRHDAFNWLIVALGVGIFGLAWYLDRQRARQRDADVAAQIAERTAALTRRPWQSHERLEVPPDWWFLGLMLFVALVGGGMVQLGVSAPANKWPLVLGGAFFLAIGVLLLPSLLASIGKPALLLDRKGLTTPVHGAIQWAAVEGIILQTMEHRGAKSYLLMFRVPAYAKAVPSVHWSQRWLAPFGLGALRLGHVAVTLRPGKERPETIEAVARHLWKSATGREYVWNPLLSAGANDSFRQLATLRQEMEAPGDLERELKESPTQALARMERAMDQVEQFRRHVDVINDETKKASRKINWVIGLVTLGMVVMLLWPWLKRW